MPAQLIVNAYDLSPFAPMLEACDTARGGIGYFPPLTGDQIHQQIREHGTLLAYPDLESDGALQVHVWSAQESGADSLLRPDQAAVMCYNTLSGAVMLSCARTRDNPLLLVAQHRFVALFYDEEWRVAAVHKVSNDQRHPMVVCVPERADQARLAEDFINRLART